MLFLALRYARYAKKHPHIHRALITFILVTIIVSLVGILNLNAMAIAPLIGSALTLPFFAKSSKLKKQLPN
jgi:hypothetical protein